MNFKIKKPAAIIIENNIKPSHQRIKIYEYLSSHFTHPTADRIFNDLKEEIPTLSKSTVYNTLKAFVKTQLVREISIEDNEIRYEFNLHDHGHFKCNECGAIYDFTIEMNIININELNEFQINDRNVYFKGICKRCLASHLIRQ